MKTRVYIHTTGILNKGSNEDQEAHSTAQIPRKPPKRGAHRVVLTGES